MSKENPLWGAPRIHGELLISGGHLFSTLMTVPWAFTFPDLFEQTEAIRGAFLGLRCFDVRT